ncbi:unnamed protein product [marine sediment metagenome]|uniref:Uncharacterized protein n=1 Tax=marine sediment metagenome TaxID=412755 RepID=X0TIT0_9ZZZZ
MVKKKITTINNIFKESAKAEFVERVGELLATSDKVVVCFVQDKDDGEYTTQVVYLGYEYNYEVLGTLELAKEDILEADRE